MTEISEQARLRQILEFCLDKDLERILLSNPADADAFSKSKLRPLLFKGRSDLSGRGAAGQTGLPQKFNKRRGDPLCRKLFKPGFSPGRDHICQWQGHCPCKQKRKDDGKV